MNFMDEIVAFRADRDKVHESFIAKIFIGPMMQVHSRLSGAITDVAILAQL